VDLAGIPDGVLAAKKADEREDEEHAAEPEKRVLPPRWPGV
jgi:hypothetical protein